MLSPNTSDSLTGNFAMACEQLNAFARSLWSDPRFTTVQTGADIRHYASGWRLEKWVEAQLKGGDLCAAWWIEFGPGDAGWKIESSVAINPDDFHLEFDPFVTTSDEEVKRELPQALFRLANALRDCPEFASALARHL